MSKVETWSTERRQQVAKIVTEWRINIGFHTPTDSQLSELSNDGQLYYKWLLEKKPVITFVGIENTIPLIEIYQNKNRVQLFTVEQTDVLIEELTTAKLEFQINTLIEELTKLEF